MTRINKSAFNVREKLTELGRRFGLKGSELAGAETVQDARDLVSAGRKNIIINGGMAVAQRGTSTAINTNVVGYAVDRFAFWRGSLSTTITGTQQTVTDLPEHTKSFRVTSAGADTITANTDGWIKYIVEDKDFDQVNWLNGSNKSVTLSFWAKSNRTGQFSINLNAGTFSTAKNIKTYTLDSANTWKKIEVTYPAPSTWAVSGNRGAILYWGMATGSTYSHPTANAGWTYASNYIGTVGDTQIYGDDGAYFEITGLQLEVGKNATDFEYRSYGEELALCQRYYFELVDIGGSDSGFIGPGHWWASDQLYVSIPFPVEMRTVPTYSGVAAGTAPGYVIFYAGGSTGYLNASTGRSGIQRLSKTSALTYWQYWKSLTNGTGSDVTRTAGESGWLERRSAALRINFSSEL